MATERKPIFHIAPPRGWINDPNGPIFYKGYYHMFYQYVETGCQWSWGLLWGHAVSRDLVTWQHMPPALAPSFGGFDGDGCFSGCCTVDEKGVPVILYTGVRLRSSPVCGPLPPPECDLGTACIETQCLAVGNPDDPKLTHWVKEEAPFLSLPPPHMDLTAWRDPYVLGRPGDHGQDCWTIMVGAGVKDRGGTALVYRSKTLRDGDWTYVGELCRGFGDTGIIWECPVMLPLPRLPAPAAALPASSAAAARRAAASARATKAQSPLPPDVLLSAPPFVRISASAVTAGHGASAEAVAEEQPLILSLPTVPASPRPPIRLAAETAEATASAAFAAVGLGGAGGTGGGLAALLSPRRPAVASAGGAPLSPLRSPARWQLPSPAALPHAPSPPAPRPPSISGAGFGHRPHHPGLASPAAAAATLAARQQRLATPPASPRAPPLFPAAAPRSPAGAVAQLLSSSPAPGPVTPAAALFAAGDAASPAAASSSGVAAAGIASPPSTGGSSVNAAPRPPRSSAPSPLTPITPFFSGLPAPGPASAPNSAASSSASVPGPASAAAGPVSTATAGRPSPLQLSTPASFPPLSSPPAPASASAFASSAFAAAAPEAPTSAVGSAPWSRHATFFCVCPDDCNSPAVYYLGHYDGEGGRFNLAEAAGPFMLDLGDIFYAPNTLTDPDGRSVLWGWLQEKPRTVGAYDYAGCLSMPRLLYLEVDEEAYSAADAAELQAAEPGGGWCTSRGGCGPRQHPGVRLVQRPPAEIEKLRVPGACYTVEGLLLQPGTTLPLPAPCGTHLELLLTLAPLPQPRKPLPDTPAGVTPHGGAAGAFSPSAAATGGTPAAAAAPSRCSGLMLHSWREGAEGSAALLYHWDTGVLEVVFESLNPHTLEFSLAGPGSRRVGGPLLRPPAPGQPLQLRVFLDYSVLEVYTEGGEVLTARVYRGTAPPAPAAAAPPGGVSGRSSLDGDGGGGSQGLTPVLRSPFGSPHKASRWGPSPGGRVSAGGSPLPQYRRYGAGGAAAAGVELVSYGCATEVVGLEAHQLGSIWVDDV
ncbi:hypothetical protein HYH03_007338 [Edaphochlamys debaryana]|uniref:Uncharacterized protein n=1 Tax=Edaphochlamys debaryana TaxID=47281 RepID=A0A835Y3L2_9CHLO|nr:hypothetical protein HYH03_007338 [Edaphochlamys debaryana]|eukprot:KAG2494572.1 hypothetical protein HYH03_007338 [Edaphochlamys debaryana]